VFPQGAIDEELISYAAKQGNTLTGLTRGVGGTAPTFHARGAVVTLVATGFGSKRTQSVGSVSLAGDFTESDLSILVNDASELPDSGTIKVRQIIPSSGATCSADNPIPCDPADASHVVCGGARCLNFGGETAGQNVDLDDSIDSVIGDIPGGVGICQGGCSVPPTQSAPDGFLLEGNCTDDATCQIIIFVVDASGSCSITSTRACAVDADCVTCSGGAAAGSPCVQDSDCAGGGTCTNTTLERCIGFIPGGISFSASGFKVGPYNLVFGTAGANGAG
jgi:hypothetical protein